MAPGRYEKGELALTAKRWAMVIDTRLFRGPEDYEPLIEACHKVHNVPHIPGNQDIKWFWLDKYERVFPDDMNAHINDKTRQASYPLLCNHCTNPPCVRVCPTQATYRMEDGIVAMDYHRCIGCRFCMAGCPYGVEKCTFCAERLAAGQMPACVEAAGGKILFGDLEDPNSTVRQALAANYSIRRKPNLGTQPGVYYLI